MPIKPISVKTRNQLKAACLGLWVVLEYAITKAPEHPAKMRLLAAHFENKDSQPLKTHSLTQMHHRIGRMDQKKYQQTCGCMIEVAKKVAGVDS